ncbi:TonB-dependent siderophore receptor [Sphingomonas phyllosphaerae]|uniref:TonB-dependent siderophore receptor n=1 Tax=Sphingomonas phyllosphaerae TaxID=257003 RepID=UPI0024131537|nr:TonB-dependent siderophore receptor [Sphingomonas phyllosphaerae]
MRRLVTGAAATIAAFAPTIASAQRGETPEDEIVVTADRPESYGADAVQAGIFRDARQLDIPATFTILRRAVLDTQQARSLADVLHDVPGVSEAQISALVYANVAIRGIPANNFTNYRLNGVLPIVNLVDAPIETLDRVEVLKGAAGLRYGFAAPSGIVDLVSKRPSGRAKDRFEAFGDTHGGAGAALDIDRPLTDGIGLRVNAGAAELLPGIDQVDGWRRFAAAAIDWRPSERLTITLDVDHVARDIAEPTEFALVPRAGRIVLPPLPPTDRNLGARWMRASAWRRNLLLRGRYVLAPGWSASLSMGESRLDRARAYSSFGGFDAASGDGIVTVLLTRRNPHRVQLFQVDLAGTIRSGPILHHLVLGAAESDRTTSLPLPLRYRVAQNLYRPRILPPPAAASLLPSERQRTEDAGLFLLDRAALGEWLDLTVGHRFTAYRERDPRRDHLERPALWSYAATLKPTALASLYASHVEGLEPGGTAQQIAVNFGETLPAARSTQEEIGAKLTLPHALTWSAAWFRVDRAASYINDQHRFVQDGRARYQGIELSGAGELAPALSLLAGATLVDARQRSGAAMMLGKLIENTPRRTGSLLLTYRLAASTGLDLSVGATAAGRRALDSLNLGFVPGHVAFAAGAGYRFPLGGRAVTLRVYGEAGGRHWAATGSDLLAAAPPASIRLSLASAS